jgi:threonine dehydrogenase-like Zn-dependent dehydrogenase
LPRGLGAELTETAGVDRPGALEPAVSLVRRGGTIAVSGVHGCAAGPLPMPMPMPTMFDKRIQPRMGQGNVRRRTDDVLPLLTDEDPPGADGFTTHHVPLDEAPDAYAVFQKKEDGAIKVLIQAMRGPPGRASPGRPFRAGLRPVTLFACPTTTC